MISTGSRRSLFLSALQPFRFGYPDVERIFRVCPSPGHGTALELAPCPLASKRDGKAQGAAVISAQ